MKTLLKIFAGIGALVVFAIAAIVFMSSGMTDTANEFFTAAKSNDYDAAYALLSEDFRSNTSKTQLQAYLEKHALTHFKETSWENRSVNGSRGELTGSVTTESGGVVPISLGFVKGESGWRIYSIKKPSAGLLEGTETAQLPSEKEQVKLVSESMHVFAVSVKEKSMAEMRSHVSNLWQQQFDVAKFDEAFGSFFQFGDALMVLDKYSPQFSEEASIDEDGVMVLKGLYPTRPNQVYFEQKYIYEGLGWKLTGFNINIK